MEEDDGAELARRMKSVLETPTASNWSVSSEDVRQAARWRWVRSIPSSALLATVAAAAALLVVMAVVGHAAVTSHHQTAIQRPPSSSRSTSAQTLPVSGTHTPPTSGPSAIVTPTTSATATTTTPNAPTTSTSTPPAQTTTPAECRSGSTSITISNGGPNPLCLLTGATVTVTFIQTSEFGGVPGAWIGSVTSNIPAVVSVDSSSTGGTSATAVLRAVSPGMTTVGVSYQNECSSSDSPPCTIPPQAQEYVTVQVSN